MRPLYKFLLALIFLAFGVIGLTAAEISSVIKDRIISDYNLDTEWYEVELISHRLNVTEVQPEEIELIAVSNKEPLGLFTVVATVSQDGRTISRGQVRLRIRKFAEVLVATDKISRQERFDKSKLVLKRMEVTSLRQQPVTGFEALENHRARLIIRKDRILSSDLIEPVPDIEVGHEVTIILNDHLLTITAPGRSLQSGSHGDMIRVKNKATGKMILARVINQNTVKVDI